jgi:hypothetical protein
LTPSKVRIKIGIEIILEYQLPPLCQERLLIPDSPSVEFAGDSRRWARRRTKVLQAPTNKEDSVKSADPKGQKNEVKNSLVINSAR